MSDEISLADEDVRPFPFEFASIQSQIDEAIASIPDGEHGAIIAIADRESAKLAVVAKLGAGWSFVGFLAKPYDRDLETYVSLRRSF